jgi:hypothetical protein
MDIVTLDFETFWSPTHSLSKMSPIEYVTHADTELISMAIKVNKRSTFTFFGEGAIRKEVKKVDWANSLVIAHNMSGFDAMILAWRLGVKPKLWGCTLAMARPIHAKDVGLGLGKLVEHYRLGVKDQTVLHDTKGKHLKDFTPEEQLLMAKYNKEDVEQCFALFNVLKHHYTARELWHIDCKVRALVDPQFVLDVPLLETGLSVERDHKRRAILSLGRHLRKLDEVSDDITLAQSIDELEEGVRAHLASAPKFSALLESLGVETPTKPSPSVPGKIVPALAKTDEAFLALQEHDDELVANAARARLSVKSTLAETRMQAFVDAAAAANDRWPVTTHYCGADTTGRASGWHYNPLNLPRIDPKKPRVTDALRRSVHAPPGHVVVVADSSGIELRVNHFLWKVASSMALYTASPDKADLYIAFASKYLFNCEPGEVTKNQRQVGKIAQLGLGFGAGAPTFQKIARIQGGLKMALRQADSEPGELAAEDVVNLWRAAYAEIVQGWKACGKALPAITGGAEIAIDPWGLVHTCPEGLQLPSGRLIRYPSLRKIEDGSWDDGRPKFSYVYGHGRHQARLTGPKVDENIVQALARDYIYDVAFDTFKETGFRPGLEVYDELAYSVPESVAQDFLGVLQGHLRKAPRWWPELIVWSEGDIARRYGDAK